MIVGNFRFQVSRNNIVFNMRLQYICFKQILTLASVNIFQQINLGN